MLSWGISAIGMLAGGAIVSLTAGVLDHALALRLPYLVAAAGFFALFMMSVRRLCTLVRTELQELDQ